MKTEMIFAGMTEISVSESMLVYGGRNETVGRIVELFSYCAGAVAKLFYLAEQESRYTLARQFERGEQIIWK